MWERGPNISSPQGQSPVVVDDIANDDEEEKLVYTEPEAEGTEDQIP